MNETNEVIDQSALAESVANGVKYQFLDFFLVKPWIRSKLRKSLVNLSQLVHPQKMQMESKHKTSKMLRQRLKKLILIIVEE